MGLIHQPAGRRCSTEIAAMSGILSNISDTFGGLQRHLVNLLVHLHLCNKPMMEVQILSWECSGEHTQDQETQRRRQINLAVTCTFGGCG